MKTPGILKRKREKTTLVPLDLLNEDQLEQGRLVREQTIVLPKSFGFLSNHFLANNGHLFHVNVNTPSEGTTFGTLPFVLENIPHVYISSTYDLVAEPPSKVETGTHLWTVVPLNLLEAEGCSLERFYMDEICVKSTEIVISNTTHAYQFPMTFRAQTYYSDNRVRAYCQVLAMQKTLNQFRDGYLNSKIFSFREQYKTFMKEVYENLPRWMDFVAPWLYETHAPRPTPTPRSLVQLITGVEVHYNIPSNLSIQFSKGLPVTYGSNSRPTPPFYQCDWSKHCLCCGLDHRLFMARRVEEWHKKFDLRKIASSITLPIELRTEPIKYCVEFAIPTMSNSVRFVTREVCSLKCWFFHHLFTEHIYFSSSDKGGSYCFGVAHTDKSMNLTPTSDQAIHECTICSLFEVENNKVLSDGFFIEYHTPCEILTLCDIAVEAIPKDNKKLVHTLVCLDTERHMGVNYKCNPISNHISRSRLIDWLKMYYANSVELNNYYNEESESRFKIEPTNLTRLLMFQILRHNEYNKMKGFYSANSVLIKEEDLQCDSPYSTDDEEQMNNQTP